jgi:uncharacterized SAM-binding protein YcdF (DUF218 family)
VEGLITTSLSALVMPPGILLVLLLIAVFLTWRRPRLARGLVFFSLLTLYALSTHFVSSHLLKLLEPEPQDPRGDQSGQAIVVLAGGAYIAAPEYGQDTVNAHTLVRLRYGAALHRALKKPILVSGGPHHGGSGSEAKAMRQILQEEFRVPVQWSDDASSNTLANARGSAGVLGKAGIKRIYLVTHAWHMPRARYAFESAGFSVIPAPTGYTTRPPVSAFEFIPAGQAFLNSSWFFHEVLGTGWYHLRIALGL